MKGPHTVAAKEKMRRAMKAKWADPEYRAYHSNLLRSVCRSGGLASAVDRRPILPAKGTPRRRHFEKCRKAFGTPTAHEMMRRGEI